FAAAIDLLFLATLAATVAREIIAGRSTRNLNVLGVLGLLFAGNSMSHAEFLLDLPGKPSLRIGVSAILLLIMLIGGRIIPSFTRNWLVRQPPGRLPRPFDRFDAVVIASGGAALALWVAAPRAAFTAWLALVAAALHARRLCRWAGERTLPEPL